MGSAAEDLDYPKKILEYRDGFLVSKTMFTACELGVFDLLLESAVPLSSADIAQRLDVNVYGVSRLLDACVGLNLLEMEKNSTEVLYKNTEMASVYLTKSSPSSLLHMMMYFYQTIYKYWDNLTHAVREGKSQHERTFGISPNYVFEDNYRSEDEMLKCMRFMDSFWVLSDKDLLTAFDLSSFPTVCDLGGCTGTLAKYYLLANPNSTVTVYDLPEVVEAANKHFIFPEDHQITFIKGNFFKDPIPEADLYILARIIHDWNEDQCMQLLTKVYNSCKPGGGVLLLESLLNEDKSGCLPTQLYSLIMMLQSDGGERTPLEYTRLLTRAGFRDIEIRSTGTFYSAILGRK